MGGEDRPAVWAAFDPEGRPVGTISLPMYFRITDSGPGYILGIDVDPTTGVQRVRLYRIGEPAE